ncbi:hypothetical protein AAF712_011541 [Marasmius tenuissimus]|uniref:Uncharacterized protein n=1 Tax=Marasmius tenuissimus TaxID=585030 RepID=A0ABR2ZK98_9AGAR
MDENDILIKENRELKEMMMKLDAEITNLKEGQSSTAGVTPLTTQVPSSALTLPRIVRSNRIRPLHGASTIPPLSSTGSGLSAPIRSTSIAMPPRAPIFTGITSTLLLRRLKRRQLNHTFHISSAPPPPLLSAPFTRVAIPIELPAFTPLPPQLRSKKRKRVDSLISEAPDPGPTLSPPPFEAQTGSEDGDEEDAVNKTKKRRVTESREVEESGPKPKTKSKSKLIGKGRALVPTSRPSPRSVPRLPPAKTPTLIDRLIASAASSLRPQGGRGPNVRAKLNSSILSVSASAKERTRRPQPQSVVGRILAAQNEMMGAVSTSKGRNAVDVVTALALSGPQPLSTGKRNQPEPPTVVATPDGTKRSSLPTAAAEPVTATSACCQEPSVTESPKLGLQPQPVRASLSTSLSSEKKPRPSSPFPPFQPGSVGMDVENPTPQLLVAIGPSCTPSDNLQSQTDPVVGMEKSKPQPIVKPLGSPVQSPVSDKFTEIVAIEKETSSSSGCFLQAQDANDTMDRAFLNFEDEEAPRKESGRMVVVLSDDSDDEVEEIPRMSVKLEEVNGGGGGPEDMGVAMDVDTGERGAEIDVDQEGIEPNLPITDENENDTDPPLGMNVDTELVSGTEETNSHRPSSPIVKPDTPSSWDLQYTPPEHLHSDLIKLFYQTGKPRKLNPNPRLICRSCAQARPMDKVSWKRFNVGESVFVMSRHVEKEHEGWYERVCGIEEEVRRIVEGLKEEGT